jgi:hypothetical protein
MATSNHHAAQRHPCRVVVSLAVFFAWHVLRPVGTDAAPFASHPELGRDRPKPALPAPAQVGGSPVGPPMLQYLLRISVELSILRTCLLVKKKAFILPMRQLYGCHSTGTGFGWELTGLEAGSPTPALLCGGHSDFEVMKSYVVPRLPVWKPRVTATQGRLSLSRRSLILGSAAMSRP